MIHAVNLGDNTEKTMEPQEVKALSISNVWLELVDPTENELQAVSDATQVAINFLRLPKTEGYVNLRLEQGFGIINFPVMQDVTSTKKSYPVVVAFSKNFLVTVAKKETQSIVNTVKERMSKSKIDPPAQVTYFIIDEIVSNHYIQIEKLRVSLPRWRRKWLRKSPRTLLRKYSSSNPT